MISVIIPSYNEEKCINLIGTKLKEIFTENKINYQLVFINDGSKDNTWEEIKKLARQNNCVKGVNFSRNFGKEAAIRAGLENAEGDCVAVIDADMQHPPETLIKMYQKWEEGYQVVYGKRKKRLGESIFKKATAALFYRFLDNLSAVCDSVHLEHQSVRSSDVREICLDRLADRVFSAKSLPDYLLHDRDIPYVPEKAVHLDNVLKRQIEHLKALFHLIESAVYLFLYRASDIANAVIDEAVIAGLDDA